MQIKDPGWFSRGKLSLPPNPNINPDTLLQDLQQAFGPQGCEVYKTKLIGADLVLKRTGFTGIALKIKQSPAGTEILFNPFAPSALARIFIMGLIPILILQAGPWKRLVADFKAYAGQSRLFGGQLGAPAGYAAMPGAPMAPQLQAAPPGYGPQGGNWQR
jgi:hypothetical protein